MVDALARRDAAAWEEMVRRFTAALLAVARSELKKDGRVSQKVDPEDVVQSVFRMFLAQHTAKPFKIADWDKLRGLLVVFTIRRCNVPRTRLFSSPHLASIIGTTADMIDRIRKSTCALDTAAFFAMSRSYHVAMPGM